MQDAADAALRPALIRELQDLEPGVITIGLAVIVLQRQFALGCRGTVLPELFDGLIINALVAGVMNDPGSFAIPEAAREGFESGHFCHHCCGHGAAPAWRDKLRVVWQEPKHPLLLEAPRESTHRLWMEAGFLRPVGGRVVGKEDEGTDHFIAPLDMIHKVQLQLGKILPLNLSLFVAAQNVRNR